MRRTRRLEEFEITSTAGHIQIRTYEKRSGPDGAYTRQVIRGLNVKDARVLIRRLKEAVADAETKKALDPATLALCGLTGAARPAP